MNHASKETLVALADGELEGIEEKWTARHLDECTSCAATLSDLRETRVMFVSALRQLDDAEPPEWAAATDAVEAIRAHAASAPAVLGIDSSAPAGVRRAPRPNAAWRWAAGLLLVVGAAGAAVLSPALLDRFTGSTVEPENREPATAQQPQSPVGVSVSPLDGVIELVLSNAAPGTRLQIAHYPGPDVGVQSTTNRFVARDGHVALDLEGESSTVRVSLPDRLRRATILAGTEELAVIENGRLIRSRTDLGVVIEYAETGR